MSSASPSMRAQGQKSDPIDGVCETFSYLDLLPSCSILDKKRDRAKRIVLQRRTQNARFAPLTRLPREVLDMILSHVLLPSKRVAVYDGKSPQTPAILQVCHNIREPALRIWLGNTEIHLREIPDTEDRPRWVCMRPNHGKFFESTRPETEGHVFWPFRPRSSWLKGLEPHLRSCIKSIFWEPTRATQLHGLPDQALLDDVCLDLGLKKGALHVPCEFGGGGSFWTSSLRVRLGPPADKYTVYLHELLGRRFDEKKIFALRDGAAPNQHSFKCYTRWGWPEEAELMRREDRIAIHVSNYNWIVAVQHMDKYCKVEWADRGKPPLGEEGVAGYRLVFDPATERGRLGAQS